MLISKVPAPRRHWVLAELLNGNAPNWCPSCRLVRPADLACSRCGSLTELAREARCDSHCGVTDEPRPCARWAHGHQLAGLQAGVGSFAIVSMMKLAWTTSATCSSLPLGISGQSF
jgi:hypothetical protein